MERTGRAVLYLGGHPQRGLQAGAGRHQPVSGRLQQSQSRFHVAVDSRGDGRGGENLPLRAAPAADSRKPHAQHFLPAERGRARAHPAPDRADRAHRHAASRNHPTDHAGAARGRAHHAGAAGAHRRPHRPGRFRPLRGAAQQRPVGRGAGHPERHRAEHHAAPAMPAGPRAASRVTLPPTRTSPSNSRSWSASIPG